MALPLLAEGRLSVGDIAARLGFNDARTFYRTFRKWTGSAPGPGAARRGGLPTLDRLLRS